FAEELPRIGLDSLRTPVTDATGLDGAWDFALSFSQQRLAIAFQGGRGGGGDFVSTSPPGGGPSAPSGTSAPDPTGAVSLQDALNKQLGLKLEMQKRPMPVLVIDHVEEKPTGN
ncbi:MAG: TIGR03435 family protein, partial [Bryobacteraceae bacterium]